MTFFGKYAGFVVDNADPAKIGRIKARVPSLHGVLQSNYEVIADADLPWANPCGTPAGNSSSTGGFSHIPGPNDPVYITFLDGELEKPVWEWGNQTLPGLQNYPTTLPLHAYDADGGATARSAWMRYNQQRLITPAGISDTTYGGYSFVISDSLTPESMDGSITFKTAAGAYLSLDDDSSSVTLVAPNFYAINSSINLYAVVNMDVTTPLINLDFGRLTFIGDYAGHVIDGISRTTWGVQGIFQSLGLSALNTVGIAAPNVYIANGAVLYDASGTPVPPESMALGTNDIGEVWLATGQPDDGLVRLSDLQYALSQIKQWLQTHQHVGVKGGGEITGPPINIPIFDVTASSIVSCEGGSTDFDVV